MSDLVNVQIINSQDNSPITDIVIGYPEINGILRAFYTLMKNIDAFSKYYIVINVYDNLLIGDCDQDIMNIEILSANDIDNNNICDMESFTSNNIDFDNIDNICDIDIDIRQNSYSICNINKELIKIINLNNIDIINKYDELIYQNIPIDNLTDYRAPNNSYAWWILTSQLDKYDMCKFDNYGYVNGFIYVFDLFNKDFRNFTQGSPFKFINDYNIEFGISGYDIIPIQQNYSRPAYYEAFYTGVYEDDIDGIDYE
jgi:hypothetical protein